MDLNRAEGTGVFGNAKALGSFGSLVHVDPACGHVLGRSTLMTQLPTFTSLDSEPRGFIVKICIHMGGPRTRRDFGFKVFMDPRQDFQHKYTAAQPVLVHFEQHNPSAYPAMIWGTNYHHFTSQLGMSHKHSRTPTSRASSASNQADPALTWSNAAAKANPQADPPRSTAQLDADAHVVHGGTQIYPVNASQDNQGEMACMGHLPKLLWDAEPVNFASESWITLGRKVQVCQCVGNSVYLDVDAILVEREAELNGSNNVYVDVDGVD
ncbi:hypothetical protein BDV93DRAFT_515954 [Ceratobasidium sp. AG-I]|nr:hypothetical protein BDV93DRAFT_515954 [Ceratobasidium sp. AG-I]